MKSNNEPTSSKKLKITDYFRQIDRVTLNGTNNSPDTKNILKEPTIAKQNIQQTIQEMSIDTDNFVKLTDVLTDDNLADLSKQNNTYVLYKYPWVKDQVPRCLSLEDQFFNATNYVKLPFQNETIMNHEGIPINKWQLIQNLFCDKIDSLFELEKAIKSYNPFLRNFQFDILRSYVNYQLNEDEQLYFFDELLPAIVRLALDLPNVITCNLPILDQGSSTVLFLSQYQISSLLANAFLCTYNSRYKDDPRCINFVRWYCSGQSDHKKGCKLEKIKCLINYFRRVTQVTPVGTISFERKKLSYSASPEESTNKVSNFTFNSQLCMFQDGTNFAQVDFANKYLGGGILNSGCVQEEILFAICPELIVSRLFTEKLLDNDAAIITGAEQYNLHTGYADKFKWKTSYNDPMSRDKYGRKCRQIIAMDALYFSWRTVKTQYEKAKIDRELTKSLSAFQCERFLLNKNHLPTIATGNWGCGVYRGDPYLKTMIQIIAASMMKRDLVYFAFDNEQLKKDFDQIKCLFQNKPNLTVAQLYRATLEFADLKLKITNLDLVGFLSQKFV